MTSKTLILITNHFPYTSGESFIEPEYNALKTAIDKIFILCRHNKQTPLPIGYDVKVVNPNSSFLEHIEATGLAIKSLPLILTTLNCELKLMFRTGRLNYSNIKTCIHDLGKAIVTANQITQLIEEKKVKGDLVIYSYWLTSSAVAMLFVKKRHCRILKISRAHGGDLYEERNQSHYLSFRYTLAKYLDRIYPISDHGANYLKTKTHPESHSRIITARLGSINESAQNNDWSASVIRIVSCSFLVPVKRVHLIIETLKLLKNYSIEWIHIGGGPLEVELSRSAESFLIENPNISCKFLGTLQPKDVHVFYLNTPVNIFINTSASEGIPVSMMEAQSFGIPIVALNVGGVSEIVNDTNGRLLSADSKKEAIAEAIGSILELPANQYLNLRKSARANWESRYNAQRNFPTFANQILALFP